MAIQTATVALPPITRVSTKASKYDFASLVTGSQVALVEDNVGETEADVEKVVNRLTSALVAYRKRSGDRRGFTTRPFKQEDGKNAVGVWCVKPAPAPKVAAVAADPVVEPAAQQVGEAEAA